VDGTAHLSSMIYGMVAAGGWQDRRGVNLLDTGAPFYDVYETADGGHMAVGALEPQFYAEFVRLLAPDGLPDRNDPANWPALRRRIAEIFASRTRDEWAKVFEGTDACVSPVLGMTEAADHPHNKARGVFVAPGGVVQPAPAPRFSATPAPPVGVPAAPGSHTRAVLSEWGLSDVDELIDSGAVHQRNED
jgi:alpha-methylacyl-CoA racemase